MPAVLVGTTREKGMGPDLQQMGPQPDWSAASKPAGATFMKQTKGCALLALEFVAYYLGPCSRRCGSLTQVDSKQQWLWRAASTRVFHHDGVSDHLHKQTHYISCWMSTG